MGISKVTIAVLLTFSPGVAFAQPSASSSQKISPSQTKSSSPEKKADTEKALRNQLALDLLKRSYALGEQVTDSKRMGLLNTQISIAIRLDKELARAWAHELFQLGAQNPDGNGNTAQLMAVEAVAKINSDEALEMLAQLDPSAVAHRDNEFPGASSADVIPRVIFRNIAQTSGMAAMPKILYAANALGEKGRYPYGGVMRAAMEIKNDDLINQTARQLLQRFQQGLDSGMGGVEFSEMLFDSYRVWPKDLLAEALDAAVDGLEKYPVNDKTKTFEITIRTGSDSYKAHGPVGMSLLKLGPVIRQTKPELWKDLVARHPGLDAMPGDAFDHGGTMITMKAGAPSSSVVPTPDDLKNDTLEKMRLLALQDPEKAAKAMSQIADPAIRAEALSYAAQLLSRENPQLSAQFAADAQKAMAEVKDVSVQYKAACARLQSDAVNNNHSALPEDLDNAFQLADKVMRKARDEGEDTGYLIEPLVEAVHDAIKIEPQLTAAHIEMVYLPFEKASMLVAAASALSAPVPQSRPPATKPEQAEKQAK